MGIQETLVSYENWSTVAKSPKFAITYMAISLGHHGVLFSYVSWTTKECIELSIIYPIKSRLDIPANEYLKIFWYAIRIYMMFLGILINVDLPVVQFLCWSELPEICKVVFLLIGLPNKNN